MLQRDTFWQPVIRTSPSTLLGKLRNTVAPFRIDRRHFLSVQPIVATTGTGEITVATRHVAKHFTSASWQRGSLASRRQSGHPTLMRTWRSLYGTVTGSGVITSLSENLPRSGYLEIFGTNFGGDGSILIGGINASVANWSSTRVVAYVPESAPLARSRCKWSMVLAPVTPYRFQSRRDRWRRPTSIGVSA